MGDINKTTDTINPIFAPYELSIENIETIGNITDICGIPCYNIPPYSLTIQKELVSERKLEDPDKDLLFYADFKIE